MPSIFKAKTTDAYCIKVLSELLQNNLKSAACFKINNNGIFLCMTDNNQRTLFNLVLCFERFNLYKFKCEEDLYIGINPNHFYKMLKSVKKKDSMVLYINDTDPTILNIKVIPKENNRISESYIKIQPIQNLIIEIPEHYSKHVIVPSNEFQKTCKDMSNIGNNIKVASKGYTIKFSCDGGSIYSKNITFGEMDEDSDEEEYAKDTDYSQTFDPEQFTRVSKISGLSNNMQIFPQNGLPLLFKTMVGSLGEISIYIKSRELMKSEEEME